MASIVLSPNASNSRPNFIFPIYFKTSFFYPLGTASLLYDFGSGGVGIGRSLVLWTEKPFSAMRTPYDGSVFDCRYRETAGHR